MKRMKLYNTLSHKKNEVVPIEEGVIKMYNCGPTVYWRVHTGNLRTYVTWDVMSRAIRYLGYDLERVMNFTDVGHMSTDEDFGEDKVEKKALEENKDPIDIANYYIEAILRDFVKMNILHPDGSEIMEDSINESLKMSPRREGERYVDVYGGDEKRTYGWVRAVDHVPEMVEIVKRIVDGGFTYETDQAVYFDVMKYPEYTKLSGQSLSEKKEAVRDEVEVDSDKKHPADFVLWMKRAGKYRSHIMYWESPWGDGFPGWHIECSAMASKYLGERFDIHTGGVDHIGVHHSNERAQNYGAFGQDGANFWVHAGMLVDKSGLKASKSKKNVLFLDELEEKGFSPMDLRYYFLTVNFRKPMAFSLAGLKSAKVSLKALCTEVQRIHSKKSKIQNLESREKSKIQNLESKMVGWAVEEFGEALRDNLNTAKALAVVSKLLKSDEKPEDILRTVLEFDEKVLGLGIRDGGMEEWRNGGMKKGRVRGEVKELLEEREKARGEKDFERADEIRDELRTMGWEARDRKLGN